MNKKEFFQEELNKNVNIKESINIILDSKEDTIEKLKMIGEISANYLQNKIELIKEKCKEEREMYKNEEIVMIIKMSKMMTQIDPKFKLNEKNMLTFLISKMAISILFEDEIKQNKKELHSLQTLKENYHENHNIL